MKLYANLAKLSLIVFVTVFSASMASAVHTEVKRQACLDHCDCSHDIRINRLCLDNLLANCVDSRKISACNLCASLIKAKGICADAIAVNSSVCANEVDAQIAKVGTLYANDICVSGTITGGSCNNHRATVIYSTVTTYTLGDIVNWDTIVDNPDGAESLVPFTHYTAPVAGYYMVTAQLNVDNLKPFGGNPILGVPVSDIQVHVNGIDHRETFSPFLAFVNAQKASFSSLLKLRVGDVVTVVYNVMVVDQTLGFIPVAGTVELSGNGTIQNESIFQIILVQADCEDRSTCTPVQACFPVSCDTTCTPCCTPCA